MLAITRNIELLCRAELWNLVCTKIENAILANGAVRFGVMNMMVGHAIAAEPMERAKTKCV